MSRQPAADAPNDRSMRTCTFLLVASLALLPAVTHAAPAELAPLSRKLLFPPRPNRNPGPITLVASPEIAHLVLVKQPRDTRVAFPLGDAVTVNTENALRSAFATVRVAHSRGEVADGLVLELRSVDVTPTLERYFFGEFSRTRFNFIVGEDEAKVKFVFILRDGKTGTGREIVVEGDSANRKKTGRVPWNPNWKGTIADRVGRMTDHATVEALDKLLDALRR